VVGDDGTKTMPVMARGKSVLTIILLIYVERQALESQVKDSTQSTLGFK
jgi:hypothetical protein